MLATYVHDLDPVIPLMPEHWWLQLRWYGLAYLAGFVAGYYLLKWMSRRMLWVIGEEAIGDFISALALLGVFAGGRLGYILFYQIPEVGWQEVLSHPLQILKVWEGGMASHGGILGIVIFTWFYARKHKLSWTGIGDGVCVVAPLGLFFGRIANFINGELYGRACDGVAWAVKFPLSFKDLHEQTQMAAWSQFAEIDPAFNGMPMSGEFLAARLRDNPELVPIAGRYLPDRHPSQIYEALLEGALLFAILWLVRLRYPRAPHGLLTALFFGLYAVFRIVGEQFREPDAAMVGMLSKGQFFSLFMLLLAAGFGWHAWRQRPQKGA